MIKGSRDFIGGSYDCCVTTLASLVTMCIVMLLIFHVIHIPNCLNGHVTLWVETPQPKSLCCQVWWLQAFWEWRYSVFNWSTDLARTYD